MEAKVAAYLHTQQPFSGPLVAMRELGREEASLHWPTSGTWLEANSVPLEGAEWSHQIGCRRPEPVNLKGQWLRGGSGDKRVGSEKARLQRPFRGPLAAHFCV